MFLSPVYFSLLLFVALFILMYFFRKKYIPLRVPSNFLWEEVMNEQTASPYLKKLQKNLLFFLQLIILLLLMFILVQPRINDEVIIAEEVLFIVDVSASMGREGHLDRMKDEMLDTLDKVESGAITIVETGVQPTITFYQETDYKAIKDYLEKLQLNNEIDNMENTVKVARSLLASEGVEVFIFTDGLTKEAVRKMFPRIKTTVYNSMDMNKVSLTNFVLSKKESDASSYVVVKNHLQEEVDGELHIYSENNLIVKKQMKLLPDEEKGMTLDGIPFGEYYSSRFVVDDPFVTDNEAFFVPTSSLEDVYMQPTLHYLVQKAVSSIYPDATMVEDSQLAVDGILLTNELDLNTLHPFIYLHQSNEKILLKSNQYVTLEDSLLNYVDLKDVTILSAYSELGISNLQTVVSVDAIPLILKGKTISGVPFIVINFDIADSDWPLHISFPLFFYNAITSLNEEHEYANLYPNETIIISTTNNVTVLDENGYAVASFNPLKEVITAPSIPGIYQAMYGSERIYFSVNMDLTEKNNYVSESFVVNDKIDKDKNITEKTSGEYLRWLMLVVFIVMLVEWGVHIRGYRV